MRALLDTNVVLDSLLTRAPWHVDADEILRRSKPSVIDLVVSALTVANLFYIGRKLVGVARARREVRTCLTAFQILPLDAQTLPAPTPCLAAISRTTSKWQPRPGPGSITSSREIPQISLAARSGA